MITAIRKQFKGATTNAIIWLVVLALLGVFSIPALFRQSTSAGPWIVRVNGEEIPYQDFMREVSEQQGRIAQFRSQYGDFADVLLRSMGITDPRSLAYDMLVKSELIVQAADKIGIYIHPSYISEKVNDKEFVQKHLASTIPLFAYTEQGTFDQQMLKQYLRHRGLTVRTFERSVERELMQYMVMSIASSSCYVPYFDLKQRFIQEHAARSFSILKFSFDEYVKREKIREISDTQLKEFFDRHNKDNKRYWVPEKRGGVAWKFNPSTYGITISEQEIERYYEDHKTKDYVDKPSQVHVRQIVIAADDTRYENPRQFLEEKRQELLKDPSLFANMAKEISTDTETAKQGGLLKPFSRGQQDKNLEQTAFILKNESDISPIVTVDNTLRILQLVERVPRIYKSLATVSGNVREKLFANKFKKHFADDIGSIVRSETVDFAIVDAFAKDHSGTKETLPMYAKDEEGRVVQALFGLKKDGATSFVEDGVGFVVLLTTIEPRFVPELDSIQDVVRNDMWEERAAKKLSSDIKEAYQLAKTKKSFAEIAEQFKIQMEIISSLSPTDTKRIQELEKKSLFVKDMFHLEKTGALFMHQEDDNGYLARADAIEERSPEDSKNKDDEDSLRKRHEGEYKRRWNEGFVASLYRNATIETNETIILDQEEYSI